MTCRWEDHYQALLTALMHCRANNEADTDWIECCFLISSKAVMNVLTKAKEEPFKDDDAEIRFYKEVVPKFYCEVEYHRLRYHIELFQPDASCERKVCMEFWKKEAEKLSKIFHHHREFRNYLKEGSKDKDEAYFLKRADNEGYEPDLLFKGNEIAKNGYDRLAGLLLALERFDALVNEKLLELGVETRSNNEQY